MINKSKLLWMVACVAIVFSACKDDSTEVVKEEVKVDDPVIEEITVSNANMSIINKMTATWCGPCGTWGWTLFQEIIDATEHDALIMGTYGSSTSRMYNQVAGQFKAAQAPTAGWPAFCANGSNRTEYSSTGGIYTSITKDNVVDEVARHKADQVLVGAGYKSTIENDMIKLEVKTEFFSDGNSGSEYYVGAYVMEDGVMEIQAGLSGKVAHHHVLRAPFTSTNSFGVPLEGGVTTGSTFEKTFEIALDPTWIVDNLEYGVIIWKKLGTKFKFVNAYQKKE